MSMRTARGPRARATRARAAIVGALLAVLATAGVPGAASAEPPPVTPTGTSAAAGFVGEQGVATGHRVDVRAIARSSAAPRAAATPKPFFPIDASRLAADRASARGATPNLTVPAPSRAAGIQAGGPAGEFAGPFIGISHDQQLGLAGDIEPPDTQLAAGPTALLEFVNSTFQIMNRSGVQLAFGRIEDFFAFSATAQPGERGSDPRVYYDGASGRFFATELGFSLNAQGNPASGDVLVAVSVDSNPFDGFFIYTIYRATGAFCDQPVLGISGDKVSFACNEFNSTGAFARDFFYVLNKAELLALAPVVHFNFFFSSGVASLTPALTLNPNGALLLPAIATYNRRLVGGGGTIGVVAITGVPTGMIGSVSITEVDLALSTATSVPPFAQQTGDGAGAGSIRTNDDRFLNSAWQGGKLWVGGNQACNDTGAGIVVSCLKLVQVDTSNWNPGVSGSPVVTQDLNIIGGGGFHLYYPSVTVNTGGDPYIEFSESSSTTPVSLGAFNLPQCGANKGAVQPFFFLQGSGRYTGGRWGDYSAAAVDPNDPNKLWLTGEYSGSNLVPREWGTAAVQAPVSTAVDAGRPYTGGHDAVGAGAGATDWYFAEGYTGPNFDEFLTIQNLGAAQTVCVDYLLQGGDVVSRDYNLQATSRTTIRVNDEILAGQSVSMHVHAANPIVAERPMYFLFNGEWRGGHDVMGATSLGSTFYFAEGFTGSGFDEFLTLMNPDPSAASNVDVTYFFGSGAPKKVPHLVPPHSRVTVLVNDPAEAGPFQNVSMLVQVSGGPNVLAERPMYFNFNGQWTGGHVVIGARAPSLHLDLAEGFVSDTFDEFLTILNPSATLAANLTITYNLTGGGTVMKTMSVPANTRATRLVNSDLPGGTSNSVHIDSDQPVVVERPMYFNFLGQWKGGHDAVAVDSATLGSTYLFAEGFVSATFDEFLTVENNNGTQVTVTVTYFLPNGTTVPQSPVIVPAHSRYTRSVNADFTGAQSQSVQVTSTGGNILVERPMYFAFG